MKVETEKREREKIRKIHEEIIIIFNYNDMHGKFFCFRPCPRNNLIVSTFTNFGANKIALILRSDAITLLTAVSNRSKEDNCYCLNCKVKLMDRQVVKNFSTTTLDFDIVNGQVCAFLSKKPKFSRIAKENL